MNVMLSDVQSDVYNFNWRNAMIGTYIMHVTHLQKCDRWNEKNYFSIKRENTYVSMDIDFDP